MTKRITHEYNSEKYGTIILSDIGKHVEIWLDPEQVMEGIQLIELNPNDINYEKCGKWWSDTFFEGIDFSDIPNSGLFKNFNEAKNYIESKLGKLEE